MDSIAAIDCCGVPVAARCLSENRARKRLASGTFSEVSALRSVKIVESVLVCEVVSIADGAMVYQTRVVLLSEFMLYGRSLHSKMFCLSCSVQTKTGTTTFPPHVSAVYQGLALHPSRSLKLGTIKRHVLEGFVFQICMVRLW